ncbi:MAG: hypothetical protein RR851_14395 [Clostridium sp.]
MYDKKIELGEDEEDIVDSIAMALHQIVRDNPEIFKERYETMEDKRIMGTPEEEHDTSIGAYIIKDGQGRILPV